MTIAIQAAVERGLEARASRRPLAPLSETDGDLSLDGYPSEESIIRLASLPLAQNP